MEIIENEKIVINKTQKDIGSISDLEHHFRYMLNEEKSFILEDEVIMEPNEKFIQKIERLIRNSMEYKRYITTLKCEFDLTSCKFFKNLDIMNQSISLEFHHYPFTLYEIVSIILMEKICKKDIDYDEYCKIFQPYVIADEITKLHYQNKIGLVPLSKTVHDLYHAGELFIPMTSDYIFGNYKDFMKEFKFSINDNLNEKIDLMKSKTENIINGNDKLNLNKLEMNISELIIDDIEEIQEISLNNELMNNEVG